MKPVLHINAGIGWSATKPLCHTFEKVGYCHRGSTTECNVLYYLYERKYKPEHAQYYWETDHKHRGFDFVKKNTTLHWYMHYIKSHLKNDYFGVSDFSNSNASLPLHFLKEISPILQENFDVRVTIIFRNPVRRSYSEISNWYRNFTENEKAPSQWKNRDPEKVQEWKKIKETFPDSISYWRNELEHNNPSFRIPSYVKTYNNYKSAFPKVFPIIMEDVWKDPSELSKFINCPISEMSPNVYYPERGTKCPKIKGLPDQYKSDMQDLSDADIAYGREKLDWVYKECQESGIYPKVSLKSW